MSLRTRLLLSYALVIFVCVAIMGVALLFLLRDAPDAETVWSTARLTLEAAVIKRLLRTPLQNGAAPEQIIRRLQNIERSHRLAHSADRRADRRRCWRDTRTT